MIVELLILLVVYIVLFALQDVIADKFGWYINGPEKTYYVLSTLFIVFLVRAIL